ncbi:hypothetical protein [Endozoicomonas sp. OPT23]|uniref:hypothetical protein n=1 Tax=Endozoicomonas sp. OPT23 TaxID=2072845 RepID=UPI00129B54EA|nr:hypothetical protein [Endozoicomonas sp. OPT23]
MSDSSEQVSSMSKATKTFLTVIVLVMTIAGFLRFPDDRTHESLNNSMVTAGASFAVARSLDAAISVVKSTEVSIGVASVDLGQVLNPLSDLIDKFSWVMTAAVGSLALQKILVSMTSSTLVNVVFALAGFIFLVVLWSKNTKNFKPVVMKVFKIALLLRFLVVAAVGLSLIVDQVFLNEQIEESSTQIESVSKVVTGLAEHKIEVKSEQEGQGFIDSIKSKISNLSSPGEKVSMIKEKVEDSILGFMNLIALFLLKTILIPLGFLMFLKGVLFSAGSLR